MLRFIRDLGFKRYFHYIIFQKILRINSNVPWPVHFTSVVLFPENIIFIDQVQCLGLVPGCYIQAKNGIIVGNNLWAGPGVKIISSNHNLLDYNVYDKTTPIKIGNNCWLGANGVILPNVELGDHTIVAAGAVVTKSFTEGNCIIAGVPAKIIKNIENYKDD